MTSSNENISCVTGLLCEGNPTVTGRFPSQRPVMRSFDVFFDLRRTKRLSKQWRRRWFETPSRSLYHHCNDSGNLCLPASKIDAMSVGSNKQYVMIDSGDGLVPNSRQAITAAYIHYDDVIMSTLASRITTVFLIVYSCADQRKHQSSASLAFVRGIHRWPVNSPHKGPVTRKMLPFDDVTMISVMPH